MEVKLLSAAFILFHSISLVDGQSFNLQNPNVLEDPFPFLTQENWQNDATFQSVLDKLLVAYDERIKPNVTGEKPAKISTRLAIRGLSSVDELHFDFKVKFDLTQTWRDPRLAFQSLTSSSNSTFIVVRDKIIKKIWTPDVYFVNEKIGFSERPNGLNEKLQMRIYATGDVIYVMRLSLKFSCLMKLKKYPMDSQECYIRFGSFSYTTNQLEFKWLRPDPIKVPKNLNQPKFSLLKLEDTPCQIIKASGEYTCLEAVFHLRREFSFHLLQTFFPSILLVISSWMSFWIDPSAVPARVAIGVTTLLTMVAMLTAVRVSLPPVPYIKALDVWMFVCILYIFGALIEFAVMNQAQVRFKQKKGLLPPALTACSPCCKGDQDKVEPEPQVQVMMSQGHDGTSTISISTDAVSKVSQAKTVQSQPAAEAQMPAHMNIDQLARYSFPVTFTLFVIIYWSIYSS